ncbi:MAG: hypothetical protein DRJ15_15110 [Bacteroidetes bacterium]|nr:MAG: hypothetical protein DRJ15_15110 [Bacteroidota bacterium]
MVNTGILEYKDTDNLLTKVIWSTESAETIAFKQRVAEGKGTMEAPECLDTVSRTYCGTDKPLSIKWNGDRYTTTAPSSATIRLLINNAEDRAFLEPIFNGGYTVTVYKEDRTSGAMQAFWRGQLTPSLGIEAYKQYPYSLNLNANDGIKLAEDRQFLMIDFPEPWPVKESVLGVIVKYINLNLYPKENFILNVAIRVNIAGEQTALEDIYVDPRVFMEDDTDEYIAFDKVIESLLGPLNLQLVQWKGEWWLLALDAQWDEGTVTYTRYEIANNILISSRYRSHQLGILDLYLQDKPAIAGDREVTARAQIDFIPPWQTVIINQEFQVNTNILPFANRTGNFYYGHVAEGASTMTALEFKDSSISVPPVVNNLRHWTGTAPNAPRPGNTVSGNYAPYKFNAGQLWMQNVKEVSDPENDPPEADTPAITYETDISEDMKFSRFTFNLDTLPTYKGVINATDNKFAIKKWIRITYTRPSGEKFYFWNRWYEEDKYDGWHGDVKFYRYDYKELSINARMVADIETGGNFKVDIYLPRDEHAYGERFGVLFYNLSLGIVSATFQDKFVWENPFDAERRARIRKGLAIVGSIFSPVPSTTAIHLIRDNRIRKEENNKAAGNPLIRENKQASDFPWTDEIKIDINPKGTENLSLDYIWGLDIPLVLSYHELHLSSPYDIDGDHIAEFSKDGEDGTASLLDWKAKSFINENMEYTSALSGTYKSDNISPLQLINDFEGRVYKFTKGTWHDKIGFWDTTFTEFKELRNIPGQPYKCDFSPYDFNNDFCTFVDDPQLYAFETRIRDDGGTMEARECVITI